MMAVGSKGCFYMNISHNCAMSYENHTQKIAELARSEGGIFTSAQAVRFGIPRDALSYALRAGNVERVMRGAYKMASAPDSRLDTIIAHWKLTRPSVFSYERVSSFDGVVVGGHTASYAHDFGVLQPEPCRMYAPDRMRSRSRNVSFAQRVIDEEDTMFKDGVRITRPERTIYDLVLDKVDPSLIADTLHDARMQLEASGGFSMRKLEELFDSAQGKAAGGRELLDMLVATGR